MSADSSHSCWTCRLTAKPPVLSFVASAALAAAQHNVCLQQLGVSLGHIVTFSEANPDISVPVDYSSTLANSAGNSRFRLAVKLALFVRLGKLPFNCLWSHHHCAACSIHAVVAQ